MSKTGKRSMGSFDQSDGQNVENDENFSDFEDDFKIKNSKKKIAKLDSESEDKSLKSAEKKKRDRRSIREDPFERQLKQAIELSKKESKIAQKTDDIVENSNENEKAGKSSSEKRNSDSSDDFKNIIKTKKEKEKKQDRSPTEILPEIVDKSDEIILNKSETIEETEILNKPLNTTEPIKEIVLSEDEEEVLKRPLKKLNKKKEKTTKQKKKKDSDAEDSFESNYKSSCSDEDLNDEEDFKKKKVPKAKTSSTKKKKSPVSSKEKPASSKKQNLNSKLNKDENKLEETSGFNKEKQSNINEASNDDIPISFKPITEPLKINTKIENQIEKPKINIETKPFKMEKTKLNSSLTTTSTVSPLGRIEMKTPSSAVRVGLSRNSKVKPLHPNVKPI